MEKIIVVDVAQDLDLPRWGLYTDRHDVAVALACFQGLINRQDSTTKVFLKDMPVRLFWNMADGGPGGSPDDILIEEMEREVPVEQAELDRRMTLPALSWLLENYGHLVRGTVEMPSIAKMGWKLDGASETTDTELFEEAELFFAKRAAALNTAIFNDLIPIAGLTNLTIGKREAYYFERNFLPNFETAAEALEWSFENYFDDPRRNQQLIGVVNENCQNPPHMWDYWYATYTFVVGYMLPRGSADLPELPEPARFLEETVFPKYPPGTLAFGEIEGSRLIPHMQANGFQIQEGPVPNLSALSAFEPGPDWFLPAPEPEVLDVDPDGIYIAWNTIDGDANDIALMTIKGLAADPARGEVKMGVRYNPFFIDLNPLLIRWLTELSPENIDLIPSPHDGGIPGPAEAAQGYKRDYEYAHRAGNEQFQVYNFFGDVPGPEGDQWHELMKGLNPLLCIRGYQGGKGDESVMKWQLVDDTLYSSQIGWGRWVPEDFVGAFRKSILEKKPGEPLFLIFKSPCEFGVRAWTMIKDYQQTLLDDPELQDVGNLNFVLPRDLAATVKSFMQEKGVTEL
ncbi:MAG: hypothetical protein WA771_14230 [Chthoniobacterales bacterium]